MITFLVFLNRADKFIYDLWGDTVNLASRMESHGLSGKIQITREVCEQIKEDIPCRKRGRVLIKGKGPVETFWVDENIKHPWGMLK